jgi:hypothetical protein
MRRSKATPDDGIQCLVCGNWYHALSTHLIRTHGYSTADEYRQEFGLLRKGLVSPDLHTKLSLLHGDNLRQVGADTRLEPGDPRAGSGKRISPMGREIGNANLNKGYLPGLLALHERRRSQTHCKHGHPLSGDNVKIVKGGARRCRACDRDVKKRQRERAKLSVR